MAIKISTGLATYMLVTGSAQDALALGQIRFFEGAIPATADAAETADPIWTVTASGGETGITWDSTVSVNPNVSVSMVKTPSEVWSGATAAGTVTHFRIVGPTETTGGASTSLPRIQGTVGMNTTYDFYMSNTTLTTNASLTAKVISAFTVGLPLG